MWKKPELSAAGTKSKLYCIEPGTVVCRDIRDGVHCDLRDGEGATAVLDGALHPGPEVAGLGGRLQVASTRPGRHILLPSWLPTQVTTVIYTGFRIRILMNAAFILVAGSGSRCINCT